MLLWPYLVDAQSETGKYDKEISSILYDNGLTTSRFWGWFNNRNEVGVTRLVKYRAWTRKHWSQEDLNRRERELDLKYSKPTKLNGMRVMEIFWKKEEMQNNPEFLDNWELWHSILDRHDFQSVRHQYVDDSNYMSWRRNFIKSTLTEDPISDSDSVQSDDSSNDRTR